jgi:hypothetical protein
MAKEPRMSTNSPIGSSKPNGGTRVRPVTDLDRRAASRKYAGLARTLDVGGEAALQRALDKMYPGTETAPFRRELVHRRHIVPETGSSAPTPNANPASTRPERPTNS